MSHVTIKIGAEFGVEAKKAAAAADRSLAGQMEHWAKLGRAAERILPTTLAGILKQTGANAEESPELRRAVLDAVNSFAQTPRGQLRDQMGLSQMTVYEEDPLSPGRLIQISPDGNRVLGKIIGNRFVPEL